MRPFAASLGLWAGAIVQAGVPAAFKLNTIVSGFNQPMSFAYAPDGRIFVAERAGMVKILKSNGSIVTYLDMRSKINCAWGRGILSIALDPQFATNKRFYMLYHEELTPADPDQGGSARWHVSRLLPRADNPDMADPATLTSLASDLETTGYKRNPHSGGDLDFDRNGNLLATFGDGGTPSALDPEDVKTYDYNHLHGKMIRIDPSTGNGLPSNPYYDAANPGSIRSKILARGLRNPFRFTVDRVNGIIYEGDVGWDTWEELNIISTTWTNAVRDQNMGWPCFEGESNVTRKQPLYTTDSRTSAICNTVAGEGTKPAVYAYQNSSLGAAIIMGQAYRGLSYPGSYLGKVFWADFNRDQMFTYAPGGGVTQFGTTGGFGSIVDFETAPDGNLAYLSYNEGRINEIAYLGTNHAPVANATAAFVAGTAYAFNFSAAGSMDADGDPLTFAWTFGDNTSSTGTTVRHAYAQGTWQASLKVTDSKGAFSVKALTLNAGNNPPVVTFVSPADNSTYAVGDQVRFQIQATDPEDGTLTAASVTYQVILHHTDHIHPDQPVYGLSGSFEASFPELVDTYYELKATAWDHNGGVTSKSLTILPKKVDITFASSPSGAGMTVDGTRHVTPYTQGFIVGSAHTALADSNLTSGGNAYGFRSWTNNGVVTTRRDFAFTVPNASRTMTIAYGAQAYPQVYLRGTLNGWAATLKMANQGGNLWRTPATFGSAANERFKFDIYGDYSLTFGDNAPADGIADQHGADILITQGPGSYVITFDGDTKAYTAVKGATALAGSPIAYASAELTEPDSVPVARAVSPDPWKRTVVFIYGRTAVGQDMFLRGGLNPNYANANLGRNCQNSNYECAMPIRHLNLRNPVVAPLKANDNHLDWYGREPAQNAAAVGSPMDWTTNAWSAAWGAKKTVAVDGHGEEVLNHWGRHYWMLDVEMDCSKTADGWFEVKSFISNGPGWEPDLAQPGAPYVTGNHFAKCGEVNMFKYGTTVWEHWPVP